MKPDRTDITAWIELWARQSGVNCSLAQTDWELQLPCCRLINVSLRDEQFLVSGSLPTEMSDWLPEALLHWQFSNPTVISLAATKPLQLQMRTALPLKGLAARHVAALLDSIAGFSHLAGEDEIRVGRHRDMSVVRQLWEQKFGGLRIRERDGSFSLRCSVPERALPLEVLVEPTSMGVRLSTEIIASDFVERGCEHKLNRYLLTVNEFIGLGGFALDLVGSPTLRVILPAPLSSTHVGHGVNALIACYRRFAFAVKAIASSMTVSDWWIRFNR